MNHEEYNNCLREIFTELIGDGYKQSEICEATLGSQRIPQFKGLLDGKNLGLKPHHRIMNSLGYTMHLVPIPNDNQEKMNIISDMSQEFVENFKFLLIDYLEDEEKMNIAKNRARPKIFLDVINEISKLIHK